MKTYVRYQDDGPRGFCGQICATTNPWDHLHIFTDEDLAREFMRKVEVIQSRQNPRITMVWIDDEREMYPEVQRH
ncbi:MAG: hypothetical protein U9Q97_08910 [Acidobacteriota bacterium]|nr:hypothetical protein [Acidobacteriota bacterium]